MVPSGNFWLGLKALPTLYAYEFFPAWDTDLALGYCLAPVLVFNLVGLVSYGSWSLSVSGIVRVTPCGEPVSRC